MEDRVSPPPSKRRRLNEATHQSNEVAWTELKIYSWNVNGVGPLVQPTITKFFKTKESDGNEQATPKASLRGFLRRHGWPTALFLQEVKINPYDEATKRAVEQAVKKQSDESPDAYDYEAHFCLPSDKHNARGFGGKVYGVCSIVRKDFKDAAVSNIRSVDWDAEGRFQVVETKAVGRFPKLAIINVYAVNGTSNPYKDPATGKEVGTRHNRKLAVHALLQAECRAMEVAGFQVVIAGDINIARTHLDGFPNLRTFPKQHCLNRADFEAKFMSTQDAPSSKGSEEADTSGLGMIDTFRHLHPDRKGYTYYPRTRSFGESCDRVDMILVSEVLKNRITEADMLETASERGPSDHVPLYACLSFQRAENEASEPG